MPNDPGKPLPILYTQRLLHSYMLEHQHLTVRLAGCAVGFGLWVCQDGFACQEIMALKMVGRHIDQFGLDGILDERSSLSPFCEALHPVRYSYHILLLLYRDIRPCAQRDEFDAGLRAGAIP